MEQRSGSFSPLQGFTPWTMDPDVIVNEARTRYSTPVDRFVRIPRGFQYYVPDPPHAAVAHLFPSLVVAEAWECRAWMVEDPSIPSDAIKLALMVMMETQPPTFVRLVTKPVWYSGGISYLAQYHVVAVNNVISGVQSMVFLARAGKLPETHPI